ncbi:hypothetical protein Poli38472_004890 [Pythium oligandrum]|uniref:Uncharacterized protein n=1 Tax=Pythium oligandrum TaxID=41045 RepID=A0A8K1FEU5_PYTOL|nr:hypothetical protein Poli38472_004890 [Pythium oligandrum]|eukprot:TMW59821.1 hypothetical protein Poli38472_004890 [Pythium oligandrum]
MDVLVSAESSEADATLAAVLAYVDEFADGNGVDADAVEPSMVEIDAVQLPNEVSSDTPESDIDYKPRRRATPKEQITQLRATADALEGRLHVLKTRPKTEDGPIGVGWEDVASSQRQQRTESEEKNAELRRLVEEHLKMGNSFKKLMRKRLFSEGMQMKSDTSKRQRSTQESSWVYSTDAKEALLATLEEMYKDADLVLADPRFDQQATLDPLHLVEFRNENALGPSIECLRASRIPFDYRQTTDVTWDVYLSNKESRVWSLRQRVEESERVTTEFADGTVETPDGNRAFHIKLVARRYSEPDREIILATMAMDVTRMNGKPVNGFYLRTRAWHLVRPAGIAGHNATDWRSIHVMSPETEQEKEATSENRKLFAEASHMLAAGMQNNFSHSTQAIENRLMDRMANMKL